MMWSTDMGRNAFAAAFIARCLPGGEQASETKLAEALYRTSANSGLPIGWSYRDGEARYHLSFWSVPYRTTTGCFFQIPYMSGFGGNLIVLLPSRVSAFRFADVLTDSRLLF